MKAIVAVLVGLFLTGCAVTSTTSSGVRVTTSVGVSVGSCDWYYYPHVGCSRVYLGPGYVVVPHRHYEPRPYYRYRYYERRSEDRRVAPPRRIVPPSPSNGRGNRYEERREYHREYRNTPQR